MNSGSRGMIRMNKSSSKIINLNEKLEGSGELKKVATERNLIGETKSEIFSPPSPKNHLDDIKIR